MSFKFLDNRLSALTRLILFSVIMISFACKNEKVESNVVTTDLSFFPLVTGNWVEYEVDSVVHYDNDDIFNVDTSIGVFHYFLREETDLSFIDGENQTAYQIKRYKRESDTLPWTSLRVWTAKTNNWSAQRVEDNIRFVRLKFPMANQASWSGNAYNFYPEEEYEYEEMYEPRQYGSLYFDSTISVLQNDFTSHINRIYKKEIYGAHAGLLFKEIDSVNTRNTSNGTIILNGLEYKFNITGLGHTP